AGEGGTGLADLVAPVRELSEHPLYRDELVAVLAALLRRPDPEVRILGCDALQRLGSRLALPELCPRLGDRNRTVAVAAHRALVALSGVDLPAKHAVWHEHLVSRGLVPPTLGSASNAR